MSEPPTTATGADLRRIAAWNATRHHYPDDRCVPDLVAAQAAATPDEPALVGPDQHLSYGELLDRADRLASVLREHGVGPEQLGAVLVRRSPGLAVAALAILRAGGAYTPLDVAYPPDRIRAVLDDVRPRVVITDGAGSARVPAGPWQVVSLDAPLPPARALGGPAAAARADHLAYVVYTSGSTGRPRGVEITHRSLLNLVFWHCRAFPLAAGDRTTQYASPGFDAAVWELWPPLVAGASVHFPPDAIRPDPERLRDWLVEHRIAVSFLPTPVAERIMTLPWPPATALRLLLTGGDTLHQWPRPGLPFTLINNYGPTEATVVATSGVVPWASGEPLPSIGWPIDNTEIHVVDERLRPVPPGVVGELLIGGAGLARGYRNQPELTAERFVWHAPGGERRTRLYRTGDLAVRRPDGRLMFCGRRDDQVKVRGHRIETEEVAAALDAHPSVQASAVVGRAHGDDTRLVAYVVPAPGAAPAAAVLRQALARTLPDVMVPSLFVRVEALPLTPNGKVDRAGLPVPDAGNVLRDEALAAASTPVEVYLADTVAGLLGLDRVGLTDNFFMLGGHSLLGTQLIARIRQTFGVDLSLRTIFDYPTVAGLAGEVERARNASARPGDLAPAA
jgi:amino acid adenylation domain-containing protein